MKFSETERDNRAIVFLTPEQRASEQLTLQLKISWARLIGQGRRGMAGVLPLSKDSPLICYAIRKLNPDIFSHPVWIRFLKKNIIISQEAIQGIYTQAEQLQGDNYGDACQIFLLCSALQSYSGRLDSALRSAQQALALAERNHRPRELIWAAWGVCAICYQASNYEQAIRYLEYLQSELNDQKDWILADFVDVIRQSLCQPEMGGVSKRANFSEGATNDPFLFTFQRLQKWGMSFQEPESEGRAKLSIRFNNHNNGERHLSVWQSIRSLLCLQQYGRKIEAYADVKETQKPAETVLEPIKASTLNDTALFSNSKPVLANDPVHINHSAMDATTYIPVAVHMLGAFDLMIGERSVKLSASRGLSLLKYLLLYHRQNTSREVLMDIFWPDAEPETARNNLNVAIHSLRAALRSVIFLPVIIFEDGAYGLTADLQVWLDVEEFEKCVKSGQQLESQKQLPSAITKYETAISLYQGDLLDDTPYESWTVLDRERLRIVYLDTVAHLSLIYFNQERYAACITLCQLILTRDLCREDAHCRLMQCYSRLGQGPLALRQYQICIEALRAELEVDPAPETTLLYEQIRRHERVQRQRVA